MAADLIQYGYILRPVNPGDVERDRYLFNKYLKFLPEHKPEAEFDGDVGAGSFGAINYASSYHCPAAISCDHHVYSTFEDVLINVAKHLGLKNSQIIPDRLCYRTKAQPTESYHYDASAGAEETDVFYGTIYNLNKDLDQVFTLVPGTHKMKADLDGGAFTTVDPDLKADYKKREITIAIPPGHALLFNENVIHRVSGRKPKKPILRKFVGFRLTNSDEPWCPENVARMEEQAALAHKGGQVAPMFPRLWLTNWPDKCEEYSKRLIPEMLTTHTYASGKKKGRTITIPHRKPPSLTVLGKRYPVDETALNRFKLKRIKT